MKRVLIFFLSFIFVSSLYAKAEKWIIDDAHTKIGFEISHLLISSVEGRYNKFGGEIVYDAKEKDPKVLAKTASFKVEIDASSIDTGDDKRDNHLRSPDFFNVKKKGHEKIVFKSTRVRSKDGKRLKVMGDLTINGVTKPVTIKFKYLGSATAYDVLRVAFTGKLKIKREDFNLTWNDGEVKASSVVGKVAEASGAVGSEVEIDLKVQAKRAADLK